jgi:hypothetical protein
MLLTIRGFYLLVGLCLTLPALADSNDVDDQWKADAIAKVSRKLAITAYERAYKKNAHLWRAQLILNECGDAQLAKEIAKRDDTSGVLGIALYGISQTSVHERDNPSGPKPDYRLVNFMLEGLKDGYVSGVGETFFTVVAKTPELKKEHCEAARLEAKALLAQRPK